MVSLLLLLCTTEGVWMLNVKFVVAVSYERIHRSNLVLFGVIPLQFKEGQDADSLGLTGKEKFSIDITGAKPKQDVIVKVEGGKIPQFATTLRFDTETELEYYRVRSAATLLFLFCLHIFVSLTLGLCRTEES
jgi:aconitase A